MSLERISVLTEGTPLPENFQVNPRRLPDFDPERLGAKILTE